jgi:steroid 5-alpha reductase family enzyme
MFDTTVFLYALVVILASAFVTWMVSLPKRDVSIIDSMWSLLFALAAGVYLGTAPELNLTTIIVFIMVSLWALRLSAYITWRHWGEAEDRRYQHIRERNQPGFAYKSLYLVFGLQGVLAWIISLPLLVAIHTSAPLGWLSGLGILFWLVGMIFEAGGDWQLARFKADPAHQGRVLNTGFWRYTRHPNYFGNALIWWGFFLIALAAGGGWTVISPILMTVLLLKVSGVALLEKDIGERRPEYRAYIQCTNAFFPGLPHMPKATDRHQEARV